MCGNLNCQEIPWGDVLTARLQDAARVWRVASAGHLRPGRDNTAIYHRSAHHPRAQPLWPEHWAVTKTNFIIRSPLSILRLAPIIGGSYVTIYHLSGAPPTLCPTRAADNQTQGNTLRAIFCLNGNAMRCFWWKLWFFRVTISILTISVSFSYRARCFFIQTVSPYNQKCFQALLFQSIKLLGFKSVFCQNSWKFVTVSDWGAGAGRHSVYTHISELNKITRNKFS